MSDDIIHNAAHVAACVAHPVSFHPAVEVVSSHKELSFDAVIRKGMVSIGKTVAKPADRTGGIASQGLEV